MSVATVDMADEPWAAEGPWTVDDLARLPDNGQRYEIIDGGLLVSPPPGTSHQRIAHRLTAALNRTIAPDWEALEGVGVVLRQGQAPRLVTPDVVVTKTATIDAGPTTLDSVDVRLAVEVVSPSSVAKDRVLKPTLLAEAGIPAYWRVEHESAGAAVFLHRLAGDVYKDEGVVRAGETRELEWPVRCRLAPAELTGR